MLCLQPVSREIFGPTRVVSGTW